MERAQKRLISRDIISCCYTWEIVGGGGREARFDLRVKDAQADDGLAGPTGGTTVVGCVVGSLCGKGRQPDDSIDKIKNKHGLGVGYPPCARVSRGHDQVYPYWDGQEALDKEEDVSIRWL